MKTVDCASFERLVGDLVEGRLAAPLAADMADHAGRCPRCAATLAEERALCSDLRALAAATEHARAPERVERALLAAVRNRSAEELLAPTRGLPAGRPWFWGIAAAILLASGLGISRLAWRAAHDAPAVVLSPAAEVAAASAAPVPAPGSTARSPRPVATKPSEPAPIVREKPPDAPQATAARQAEASVTIHEGRATIEEASEFVPLAYGDTLTDVESVHVVRVQLQPAALTALGLPGGEGGDARPVNADLMVGHDGVARAIRFVR